MTPKNFAAGELGRWGGKARARKLTLKEPREAARKAMQARWAQQRELTKAISEAAGISSELPKPRPARREIEI
jgi:hypothetical protein